jgi:hypothetical protein
MLKEARALRALCRPRFESVLRWVMTHRHCLLTNAIAGAHRSVHALPEASAAEIVAGETRCQQLCLLRQATMLVSQHTPVRLDLEGRGRTRWECL